MVYFSLCSSTFYHSSCTRPEKFYTREHMFTEIPSPLFFFFFFFFFPLSRIHRPRGIDRYIFELAPVCVFNRHTRLLNFIGVVHSRARSPSIPRSGPRIYRRRVLSIFYARIYTKIFQLSQLEIL